MDRIECKFKLNGVFDFKTAKFTTLLYFNYSIQMIIMTYTK